MNLPLNKVEALSCIRCSARYPADLEIDSKGCPRCRSDAPANLTVSYSQAALDARRWPPVSPRSALPRFADFLPFEDDDLISLNEGNTPLTPVNRLGAELGIKRLFIKDETRNPTWSHKDRFSAVAVTHARKHGATVLATASSGNAGASLAAYAAKAGLPCVVLTFEKAAGPMLEQIERYGAMILPFRNPADRWPVLAEAVKRYGWFATSPFATPVVGSHPIGIEGYKTVAYELYEQLGRTMPDWLIVPTAYGDVLSGICRGFQDLMNLGLLRRLPKLVAAEIYGSLNRGLLEQNDCAPAISRSFETIAVSIGTTQSTFQALTAIRQSEGAAVVVSDDDLLLARNDVAFKEGILGELSAVATIAAARKLRAQGVIHADDTVVCLVTAPGLKDAPPREKVVSAIPGLPGTIDAAFDHLATHYGFQPAATGSEGRCLA